MGIFVVLERVQRGHQQLPEVRRELRARQRGRSLSGKATLAILAFVGSWVILGLAAARQGGQVRAGADHRPDPRGRRLPAHVPAGLRDLRAGLSPGSQGHAGRPCGRRGLLLRLEATAMRYAAFFLGVAGRRVRARRRDHGPRHRRHRLRLRRCGPALPRLDGRRVRHRSWRSRRSSLPWRSCSSAMLVRSGCSSPSRRWEPRLRAGPSPFRGLSSGWPPLCWPTGSTARRRWSRRQGVGLGIAGQSPGRPGSRRSRP